MAGKPAPKRPRARLYLITPPQLDPQDFAPVLDAALTAGDVASLQLRLKAADNLPPNETVIKPPFASLCR